ncbi:MAG: hypothetical protein U1E56_00310 [Bauldia sp.]
MAARQVRELGNLQTLADAEFQVFSQWGEDGIIEWLVHHASDVPESFIEFGVGDYREANTRFLLATRNWRGLVIEASDADVARIKSDAVSWRHDLTAVSSFITRSNIGQLIRSYGFGGELGILSIDIDGNDYWVWEAIDCVRPWLVIAEYNAVFGDLLPITVPPDDGFIRQRAHYSNLYYGASIAALCRLGEAKGYALLGTNRAGNNAFFVRNDRRSAVADRIADRRPRPSRFREARDRQGRLTLLGGTDRLAQIRECPVVNVASGETLPIGQAGALYSERWLSMMRGHAPAS